MPLVINALGNVTSVCDFGCGLGTWLSVVQKLGIADILGVDGEWVDTNKLKIPVNCFRMFDLERPIILEKKYALAMSLEVAEHIPETSADTFVTSLVSASDIVLFSAAIPFQGGTNHINERWPEYWYNLFAKKGFIAIDFLRPLIWENSDIDRNYRQNTVVYVNKNQYNLPNKINSNFLSTCPPSYVHSELYTSRMLTLIDVQQYNALNISVFRILIICIKRFIKFILGKRLTRLLRDKFKEK